VLPLSRPRHGQRAADSINIRTRDERPVQCTESESESKSKSDVVAVATTP
jgi:hypothetical protein